MAKMLRSFDIFFVFLLPSVSDVKFLQFATFTKLFKFLYQLHMVPNSVSILVLRSRKFKIELNEVPM